MKTSKLVNFLKSKARFLFLTSSLIVVFSIKSLCQIDGRYGANDRGFRIGLGGGLNVLGNRFAINPVKQSYTATIDFNYNPFLSIGIEGQKGSFSGLNSTTGYHLPFSLPSDNYYSANLNMRFSYGLVSHFERVTRLNDLLNNTYIGAGIGVIKSSANLVDNKSNPVGANQTFATDYTVQPNQTSFVFPLNVGFNYNLPQINGKEMFSINPNFQYNLVGNKYLEGFTSTSTTVPVTKYNLFSVSLKYKL